MSEPRESISVNENCPWSGNPVAADALASYRGATVGFCNPGCRDKFVQAIGHFDACIAAQASASNDPWTPSPGDPALHAVHQEILAAHADLCGQRVVPEWDDAQTKINVGAVDLSQPIGLVAAIGEAAQLMRQGDLRSASARCFGYFNPTAAWPAIMADFLVAARNPQICVVSHASASARMERHVIDYMLGALGFPTDATGHFCSGGSEANASALSVALVKADPGYAERGLAVFSGPPRIYASNDCHLAWIKIARSAGLGSAAVRLVATTADGRLDPVELENMLAADVRVGLVPVMVIATAGTTNAGEIDPIHACHALARRHGCYFHVDAAWAGALMLDPDRRPLLEGVAEADSVTIDAHKWLSVPMGAGMIFVRDAAALAQAFAVDTTYMPAGDGVDAYLTSPQWSRRFVGLRLWMMLRSVGPGAYAAMFARQFALADRLRQRLVHDNWRIVNTSPLPVIAFEDALGGGASAEISKSLEAEGEAWVGCVVYQGKTVLRACLTSFLTGADDIDFLVERLHAARLRVGSSDDASSA